MTQDVEKEINETIGAASMCWSETPKGVFDSDKAAILAKDLRNKVYRKIRHERDLEIAKILENTVMQHVPDDSQSISHRLLKDFIKVLKN